MEAIMIRAGCFVAIMLLGFFLRRIGFFKEGDFTVLSRITLGITLPATSIVSFATVKLEPAMLSIAALGFGCGIVYMLIAYLTHLRASREQRAFALLNYPSYNIGLFTMSFAESFLGPLGVVVTSLFNTGNILICHGGAYSIAALVKDGTGFSFKRIAKALFTSIPFVCYLIMLTWNLTGIPVPQPLVSCAQIARNANAFLAMLMIGVGFQLKVERKQLWQIGKILLVRYGVAVALALLFYYCLPFSQEIRQTLVILVFSPVSSAVPAFTAKLRSDVGLSSAVNSICTVISIVIMVALLGVMPLA